MCRALPLVGETQLEAPRRLPEDEQRHRATTSTRPIARVSYYEADDDADQYSGELQWSGTGFGERLEWQTSLFHLHEKAERNVLALPDHRRPDRRQTTDQTTNNKAYGAALHGSLRSSPTRFASRWAAAASRTSKQTWLQRDRSRKHLDLASDFRGCTGNLGTSRGPPRRPQADQRSQCRADVPRDDVGSRARLASVRRRPPALRQARPRLTRAAASAPGPSGEYKPEKIWAYAAGHEVRVLRPAPAREPRGLLLQLRGPAARDPRRPGAAHREHGRAHVRLGSRGRCLADRGTEPLGRGLVPADRDDRLLLARSRDATDQFQRKPGSAEREDAEANCGARGRRDSTRSSSDAGPATSVRTERDHQSPMRHCSATAAASTTSAATSSRAPRSGRSRSRGSTRFRSGRFGSLIPARPVHLAGRHLLPRLQPGLRPAGGLPPDRREADLDQPRAALDASRPSSRTSRTRRPSRTS